MLSKGDPLAKMRKQKRLGMFQEKQTYALIEPQEPEKCSILRIMLMLPS